MTFTAKLQEEGILTAITLPFDARAEFGQEKGPVHVGGKINGVPFRGKLSPTGGGVFLFGVNKQLQRRLGYTGQAMDVEVTMYWDAPANAEPNYKPFTGLATGMTALEAITTRASVRRFAPGAVSTAQMETILHAGMCAPSARNRHPVHYVVVEEPAPLEQMAAMNKHAWMLAGAGAAILVCGDKNLQGMPEYLTADCAAATQNMLLAIHALGLGGVWCGVAKNREWAEALKEMFDLPALVEPMAVIALGLPGEEKPRPPRFDETKVHIGEW